MTATRLLGCCALLWGLAACDSDDEPGDGEPSTTEPSPEAPEPEDGGEPDDPSPEPGPEPSDDVLGPSELYRSGTRLRAKIFTGEGVEPAFITWRDTDLDVDCEFFATEGDVLRCMPEPAGRVLFRDAECTAMPLLRAAGAGPAEGTLVAATVRERTCGYQNRPELGSFRVGAAVEAETAFGLTEDGRCLETTVNTGGEVTLREVTAATAEELERWMTGELVVQPGSGAVGREVVVAADGAAVVQALHHNEANAACTVITASDGETRCAPLPLLFGESEGGFFADAECSVPTLWHFGGCEVSDLGAAQVETDSCESRVSVYSRGASEVPASDLRRLNPAGQCATTDFGSEGYYTRLSEVPAADLPTLDASARSDRLRLFVARAPNSDLSSRYKPGYPLTTLAPDEFYWDQQQERRCTPLPFQDGSWRCVPNTASTTNEVGFFADASCTEPAIAVNEDVCQGVEFLAIRLRTGAVGAEPISAVYQVGEPLPGPVYVDTGECTPFELPAARLTQVSVDVWHALTIEVE